MMDTKRNGGGGMDCVKIGNLIAKLRKEKKLTQTGCILPESDIETETGRVCNFCYSFDPGMIDGDLELSLVMFIKKKAVNVLLGEENFINEEGVTIGEIESVVLDFNSIYMEFPIEEVNSPDEPLWWVYFSQWEDPKVDSFSQENICLYLNTHYSACPMVGEEIKNFDLLVDIVSTTYFMIFQKLMENQADYDATINGYGENNSICSIMNQFLGKCTEPVHFENSEALLKSLQTNIRIHGTGVVHQEE